MPRKITLRIVPFVMLLFFVSFIGRATIGFAALVMKNLGLSPSVFGFGPGIFLLRYLLFGRRSAPLGTEKAADASQQVT